MFSDGSLASVLDLGDFWLPAIQRVSHHWPPLLLLLKDEEANLGNTIWLTKNIDLVVRIKAIRYSK